MKFGVGFTATCIFGPGSSPLPKSKGYQKPDQGESYASYVDSCHSHSVGDRGHGIEQHWALLRSASQFSGARSCKEIGGRRGSLRHFLRSKMKQILVKEER